MERTVTVLHFLFGVQFHARPLQTCRSGVRSSRPHVLHIRTYYLNAVTLFCSLFTGGVGCVKYKVEVLLFLTTEITTNQIFSH